MADEGSLAIIAIRRDSDSTPPSIEELRDTARSLDPVVRDIRTQVEDRARELDLKSTPVFLLDFSELYYLWSSRSSKSGRVGTIDHKSMLVNLVLRLETTVAYIPPGTLFEMIRRLQRDLRQEVHVGQQMQDAIRRFTDPAKGVTTPVSFEELDAMLPTREQVLADLRRSEREGAGAPYRTIIRYIESGRLLLMHDHAGTGGLDIYWDQTVFGAAFDALSRERPDKSVDNSWDSLNLTLAHGVRRHMAYLVSRSRLLAKVSKHLPESYRKRSRRLADESDGVVRTPEYFYLYKVGVGKAAEKNQLVRLQRYAQKLEMVRYDCIHALREFPNERADTAIQVSPHYSRAINNIEYKARTLHKEYAEFSEHVYYSWESHRWAGKQKAWLRDPDVKQLAVEASGDDATDAVVAVLDRASEAKEFLRRLADSGGHGLDADGSRGAFQPLATHVERIRSEDDEREVKTAITDLSGSRALVLVDFVDDYFSAWWYSMLGIHEFMDWVDQFALAMKVYAGTNQSIQPRIRVINNTVSCITSSTQGGTRLFLREDESGEFTGEEGLEFPITMGQRFTILTAASKSDAIRVHTPYGDLWINLRYGERGLYRTGVISQYPVPAFLAGMLLDSTVWHVQHRDLYEKLKQHFDAHFGLPGHGKH